MATVAEALNIALDHHMAGRTAEARTLYGRILDADPGNPQALHLLGLLTAQSGAVADALPLIREAVARMPLATEFQTNLGKLFQALARPADAAPAFVNAVSLDPTSAAGWFALANARLGAGGSGNAAGGVRALDHAAALEGFDEGTPVPALAEGYGRAGLALYNGANWAAAAAAFRRARRFDPANAEWAEKLGAALAQLGATDEAIDTLRAALVQDPLRADARINLIHLMGRARRDADSLRVARGAMALAPGNPVAYANMVRPAERSGRVAEALAAADRALRLDPGNAALHANLPPLLRHLGRPAEALAATREALRRDPGNADTRLGLAMALLATGDCEEGWDLLESRWQAAQLSHAARGFGQPQWTGGDIAGRTILLHAEQGLGDTVQFVRYAPLVAARGARVVVEAQASLVGLLSRLPGVERVIARGDPLPPFDLHCPLLSLPRAFGTRLDSVPAPIPYLSPDPARAARWAARLPKGPEPRVGLVWAGNPDFPGESLRSPRLDGLRPVLEVPGVRLFGLQMGAGRDGLAGAALPPGFTDLGPEIANFQDTAAIMANLDLVISSCTAPAHLAGALGVPVWVVLPVAADWRWLLEREDSPWYPTARLFRQERVGDWSGVAARVAGALRGFLPAPASVPAGAGAA